MNARSIIFLTSEDQGTCSVGSVGMTEKIAVLDLVISVLREHEKALDQLINQLEKIIARLEDSDRSRPLQRFYEPI